MRKTGDRRPGVSRTIAVRLTERPPLLPRSLENDGAQDEDALRVDVAELLLVGLSPDDKPLVARSVVNCWPDHWPLTAYDTQRG